MAEMKLEDVVAGIGVSSDGVVVVNKVAASKGGLLVGQDVIVAEVLKERDISEDDEVAEMKLEEVVAGIGVTSDGVVVVNKDDACKGRLLEGQDLIVTEVL